jgi:uncharacterized protein
MKFPVNSMQRDVLLPPQGATMKANTLASYTVLVLSLFAFVTLSSCQSSPRKHYYLLSSPPATAQNTSTVITRSVGIGPIVIADYLDRLAIVSAQGDNGLHISDTDYWGEPLDKGIGRVVADGLRQQNPAISFVQFPYRSDARPSHSLRLQIHQLNYNGSQAALDATWELMDNTSKQVITRKHFSRTNTTAGTPADIARAYSKLLAALVEDVQPDLGRL